jgi:predicted alpha/beta hydrolase family esterase
LVLPGLNRRIGKHPFADWIENINNEIKKHNPSEVILVVHSAACAAVAIWAQQFNIKIKSALLVAPADPEADSFPTGAAGFAPLPLIKLPFPSIVVASTNDFYVTMQRAKLFADSWGSELINIGDAGHINSTSGLGEWHNGLELLEKLD